MRDIGIGVFFSVVVLAVAGWFFLSRESLDPDLVALESFARPVVENTPLAAAPEADALRALIDPTMRDTTPRTGRSARSLNADSAAGSIDSDSGGSREAASRNGLETGAGRGPVRADRPPAHRGSTEAQRPARRTDSESDGLNRASRQEQSVPVPQNRNRVEPSPMPNANQAREHDVPRADEVLEADKTVEPARSRGPVIHVMQRNETLSELAARYFGTSLRYDLILKANPEIKNPARIRAGTRILIPEIKKDGSVAAAGAASDHDADRARRTTDARGDATPRLRAYVVRNGDTLISIARRELGDSRLWKRLYDLNQRVIGAKPELLRAGMTLQLPPVGHTIPLD